MKDNNITPHKAYVQSLGKRYSDLTKEELKEYNRIYRSQWYPANREEHHRKQREWNKINKPRYNELTHKLNAWFYTAKERTDVHGDWEEVIGLSKEGFKEYVESLWVEGMSWDNWTRASGEGGAKDVWHIDHIIDVKDGGGNHHSNLRPLWAYKNYRRKFQVIEEDM